MDDKKLIGYKDGMGVYVSDTLLAQKGEREVRRKLGLIRHYPVKTDLSGNVVMVEGDSHEDAVQRYFLEMADLMQGAATRRELRGSLLDASKAHWGAAKQKEEA